MKVLDVPKSGSQANTVASRNRFGQYLRTRAMPTNPRTGPQSDARQRLTSAAAQWADLTPAQRAGWEDCAKRFPKTDSLGQQIFLSGFQQFVRSNSALTFVGKPMQLNPLADNPFGNAAIYPTVTAGTTPEFTFTYMFILVTQMLVVDVSGQLSQGVSYCSDYRNLAIQAGGPPTPIDELVKYQGKFGALIAGQKIFFRSRVLNECGVYGAPYYSTAIVEPGVATGKRQAEPDEKKKIGKN